ncbi:MAG: bifunctional folylpolyglutamate synthase/dihydrofolate synthase [Endomicrobium sp.]|jgi:dihydrofolate synthase/folylpolyglutamate synthase|nr:bifunctional folylpolyglutamate synthase/dihydrofolate synthase [Endomicrobium sp.]
MFYKILKEYGGMKPGLLRIRKFLKSVNNPQNNLKIVVHIAGTNGKGSTAIFISEILKVSGYKTALYTSPHLINITERIKINGKSVSLSKFDNLSKKYSCNAARYKLSYFEYLTALAFIYFAEQNVDIAVIETGLGGRFDATNIIKKTLICVITSIALDHQEILGNNITKIAFEKSGIIKKGTHVVCGQLPKKAVDLIKNKSNPYIYGNDFRAINNRFGKIYQRFDYVSADLKLYDIKIRLLGEHQFINASIAIFVSNLLNKLGYCLNHINIKRGLKNAIWDGRFDIREITYGTKKLKLIIDGAHNIHGLNMFFDTFKRFGFSNKKRIFVFVVMKEKKYKCMIKKIVPFAKMVILPKIDNERAVDPEILKLEFSNYIAENRICTANSVKNIFRMINSGEIVAVIGSLYLAGEILKCIKQRVI